jgi:hypothetical protein
MPNIVPTIQIRIRRPDQPHARVLCDWPITEDPYNMLLYLTRYGYRDETASVVLTELRGQYVTNHQSTGTGFTTYFEITAAREEPI